MADAPWRFIVQVSDIVPNWDVGLYARNFGLYARNLGLYARNLGLYARNLGLYARNLGLYTRNLGLYMRNLIQVTTQPCDPVLLSDWE